ncbi:dihydropteroate synthase [Streptomyces sp. L7]
MRRDRMGYVEPGLRLAEEGADLVDVGGESTRPGAEPVPVEAESARVVPVVRELVRAEVAVSVDTMRRGSARAAIEAGAAWSTMSAEPADPRHGSRGRGGRGCRMWRCTWRAPSREMDRHAVYSRRRRRRRLQLLRRVEALSRGRNRCGAHHH